MAFEIGKFYKHTTGLCLSIVGELQTTMWNTALIAETSDTRLIAVGKGEDAAVNFSEITKEEWMTHFS